MGSDDVQKGPPDLSSAVFVHAIAGRQSFPGADGSGESPERAKKIFKAAMWKTSAVAKDTARAKGKTRRSPGRRYQVVDREKPADAFTMSQQPAPASVADELAKLAQLRDRAVISADEFETLKNKLLGA